MTDTHTDVDLFLQQSTFGDDPYAGFIEGSQAAGLPPIQVSPVFGRALELLVRLTHASLVLEVGTLGGYSAAWMARALPTGGRVISLEIDPHHADVAAENLRSAGLGDRVDIRVGAAVDSLAAMESDPSIAKKVDLAFIDADKANNSRYVGFAVDLVRPGGVIVVDNVVRNGQVINDASDDPNIRGSRGALELLGSFPQLTATALQTVGVKGWDGFAIALVRESA